jgi:TATA-binding protein-associated factor Taf7
MMISLSLRQSGLLGILVRLFAILDKIKKYMGENGITDATANIRQRFFRKKPKIDHQLVDKVDMALDQIKS